MKIYLEVSGPLSLSKGVILTPPFMVREVEPLAGEESQICNIVEFIRFFTSFRMTEGAFHSFPTAPYPDTKNTPAIAKEGEINKHVPFRRHKRNQKDRSKWDV